jgi:hypothetical protein
MTKGQQASIAFITGIMLMSAIAARAEVQQQQPPPSVFDGVLGSTAASPEISTAEFRAVLMDSRAIVLDVANDPVDVAIICRPNCRARTSCTGPVSCRPANTAPSLFGKPLLSR